MINILIADDHQLILDGIKSTLTDINDFSFVQDAHHGYQVQEILDSGTSVDVILMDINMPKLDGLQCTKLVKKKYPDIKILALSQYDEKKFVKWMIKNGASGYLLKDANKDLFETAIRTVQAGEKYFGELISQKLVEQVLHFYRTSLKKCRFLFMLNLMIYS